jgi:hypothetical protein
MVEIEAGDRVEIRRLLLAAISVERFGGPLSEVSDRVRWRLFLPV